MAVNNTESEKPSTLEKNNLFGRILGIGELVPLTLLIILSLMFYFISPAFVSTLNISNMLAYAPELGIIALGLTVLMTSGEIDLSVGALFGCVPVFLYIVFNQHWLPFWGAFVASLILAGLIGLANGLIVTKFHISSLIVTLGMQLVVRGSALYFTNGFPQQTWKTQSLIKSALVGLVGQAGEFKLLASLVWFVCIAIVLHFILSNTRFGNWIMATGGNIKSAKARGVNTDRVKIILFIN
jgi:Ribose/xylose/arabinose/galactoside ABC-type transport systems, permease components